MTPRENWTDQRLDDLNKKVDDGFARADRKMDEGFARADKKMDDGFARVDSTIRDLRLETQSGLKELKVESDARFAEMNGHLLSLHQLLIRISIGGAVAVGVALIGMLASSQ